MAYFGLLECLMALASRFRDGVLWITRETDGERVSGSFGDSLHKVLVFDAGSKHGHPAHSRLNRSVEFVVVVYKDELSSLEVVSVIGEVEKGGVVKFRVSGFVDVHVPVLVVGRLGSLAVQPGEEGWVGQVQTLRVDPEVIRQRILHLVLHRSVNVKV